MLRTTGHRSVDVFGHEGDFATQVHDALRQSPWWMLSIAFHGVLVFVLSAFVTTEAGQAPGKLIETGVSEQRIEPEEPEQLDPTPIDDPRTPLDTDVPVPVEPLQAEVPVDVANMMDSNEPDSSTRGATEGPSIHEFEGQDNNGLLGTGGGPGGGPSGFGSNRTRRAGRPTHPGREDAVLHGLRWLAAHQSPDGGWEAAGFAAWCDGKPNTGERPDGVGGAAYDVGVTGLALCAFLGAGYTNRGESEFAKTVRRGLSYLRNVQDPEGCFGPRATSRYIYNHACAALAMVEAYGMTESPIWKGSAQKALDFLGLARNPYFVWRYGVRPGDNDTSVTGWMMMALKSAQLVNADAVKRGRPQPLTIDTDAFDGIRAWLEKMTDPDYGRVGYTTRGSSPARPEALVDRFPADKSESMTAVGTLARIFLGEDPRKSDLVKKGTDLCLRALPRWSPADGTIDMYYWYYATLALFQVGGDAWKRWDTALTAAIVPSQRLDGTYCAAKGSWDPIDPWGPEGGRVYSTALQTMSLEVLYRYDRVFGTR